MPHAKKWITSLINKFLCIIGKKNVKTTYCGVSFGSGRRYYYIADTNVLPGDKVLVEAGADDRLCVVEVMEILQCERGGEPYPPAKTRHIIRVCTDEDIELYDDSEYNIKEHFCPALGKMTQEEDCTIIQKVFDGMLPPKALTDYAIDVSYDKEKDAICRECGKRNRLLTF